MLPHVLGGHVWSMLCAATSSHGCSSAVLCAACGPYRPVPAAPTEACAYHAWRNTSKPGSLVATLQGAMPPASHHSSVGVSGFAPQSGRPLGEGAEGTYRDEWLTTPASGEALSPVAEHQDDETAFAAGPVAEGSTHDNSRRASPFGNWAPPHLRMPHTPTEGAGAGQEQAGTPRVRTHRPALRA